MAAYIFPTLLYIYIHTEISWNKHLLWCSSNDFERINAPFLFSRCDPKITAAGRKRTLAALNSSALSAKSILTDECAAVALKVRRLVPKNQQLKRRLGSAHSLMQAAREKETTPPCYVKWFFRLSLSQPNITCKAMRKPSRNTLISDAVILMTTWNAYLQIGSPISEGWGAVVSECAAALWEKERGSSALKSGR